LFPEESNAGKKKVKKLNYRSDMLPRTVAVSVKKPNCYNYNVTVWMCYCFSEQRPITTKLA